METTGLVVQQLSIVLSAIISSDSELTQLLNNGPLQAHVKYLPS